MKNLHVLPKILPILFSFICLMCVKVTPGHIDEDKRNCIVAIDQFHHRFNEAKYEEIYNDELAEFQQAVPKTQALERMSDLRKNLGAFQSVVDSVVTFMMGAPVQIRAVYVSKYENLVVTEVFTFVKDGNVFKIGVYSPSKGAADLTEVKKNVK